MKNLNRIGIFLATAATLVSAQARADGFICGTDDRELEVQVYNQTDASRGTRNASVMILSDPSADDGSQVIARLDGSNADLSNNGSYYVVQLKQAQETEASDVYVSAFQLSQIETITLDVHFSYEDPLPAGAPMDGTLTLVGTTGHQDRKPVSCVRYLKNG